MSEVQTTEYAKSLAVAQALRETVEQKKTELEMLEQETANAKKAFRTAFEYWTEMQPIMLTVDYFTLAAARANARFNATGQDELTRRLVNAVLDYLDYKATSSGQELSE